MGLNSTSTIKIVDLLCEGPIEGIVGGCEGVYIEETPIRSGNTYNFESGGLIYGFKRDYFGPVNVSKIKVRLIDHFGDVVDLNNTDFSFTLKVEQLYDLNMKN